MHEGGGLVELEVFYGSYERVLTIIDTQAQETLYHQIKLPPSHTQRGQDCV